MYIHCYFSDAKDNTLLNAISISSSNPESHGRNINGFSFYVHHAIVVHFIGVKTNLNHNGTWARVVLLNSTSLYKISSVTFDKSSVLTDDNNQGKILSRPGCFIFIIRLWHCYFISISKFQPFSCQMSTLTSSLQQRDFKCHLDAKQFLLDLLTI